MKRRSFNKSNKINNSGRLEDVVNKKPTDNGLTPKLFPRKRAFNNGAASSDSNSSVNESDHLNDADDDDYKLPINKKSKSVLNNHHQNLNKRSHKKKVPIQTTLSMHSLNDNILVDEGNGLKDSLGSDLELIKSIRALQDSLKEMENRHEREMLNRTKEINKVREDYVLTIERLKSELIFKDEQIEVLNQLSNRNMELEAKINTIISSREAYEEEVKIYEEKSKNLANKVLSNEDGTHLILYNGANTHSPQADQKKSRKRNQNSNKKLSKSNSNDVDEIDVLFVKGDDISKMPIEMHEESITSEGVSKFGEGIETDGHNRGRHDIRNLVTKLCKETKTAAVTEAERRARVKSQQEQHLILSEIDQDTHKPVYTRMILQVEDSTNSIPQIEVHPDILKILKPHQVEAVEFLWDCLIESVPRMRMGGEEGLGSGCILAHCMGLGKSLSILAFVHTILAYKTIGFKNILILCPLNAVLNWLNECHKWLPKKHKICLYELATRSDKEDRISQLQKWQRTGGILIISYSLFRILTSYNGRSKKIKQVYLSAFLNPGADVVVCDEGHVLKNDSTTLAKCVNKVRTKRRIVLTGTPLQNNLIEYHCMLSFVKPNLLGTRREFGNRFVNPITNGQHLDSTQSDVRLMKRRAHVLHEMLAGCVQRRDYSALVKYLPPKQEYVLSVRLSPLQVTLYEKYLNEYSALKGVSIQGNMTSNRLFSDYYNLMHIWTHPWILKLDQIRQEKKPFLSDDDDELQSIIYTSSSSDDEGDDVSNDNDNNDNDKKDNDDYYVYDSMDDDIKVVENPYYNADNTETEEDNTTDKNSNSVDKNGNSNNNLSTGNGGTFAMTDKSISSENLLVTKDNMPIIKGEDNDRRAKVIAGEVIKRWQSKRRHKGLIDDVVLTDPGSDNWWFQHIKDEDKYDLQLSGKLTILFEIIRMADEMKEKVLVFSQSLLSLDIIEDFLAFKSAEKQATDPDSDRFWVRDEDYTRMDGSTNATNRKKLTTSFNNLENPRLRLFLISTRAGGLGINLEAANRVVIFDASWNPSHDVQSIFRVYRFGQNKPVYVYRLLAQGTMEEKIYERQVTKETLSLRVIDEHQIDRHFTASDLYELYSFKPAKYEGPDDFRPTPIVPKDKLLAELMSQQKDWIDSFHEHDSLLENRPEEDLSEEERKCAWEEYEKDRDSNNYFGTNPLMTTSAPRPVNFTAANMPRPSLDSVAKQLPISLMSIQKEITSNINVQSIVDDAIQCIPEDLRNKITFQISQLPRVVQEILKYNPNISSENLKKRLQTFLGMHSRLANQR